MNWLKRLFRRKPAEGRHVIVDIRCLNPTTKDGWSWDYSNSFCPDCRSRLFNPGPTGGKACHIRCAECGSKFWYGPPFAPKRVDTPDSFFRLHVKRKLEDLS